MTDEKIADLEGKSSSAEHGVSKVDGKLIIENGAKASAAEREGYIAGSKEESILKATASDQPTYKDDLGFKPYIGAITDFLTNEKTKAPLTLSIEGEWGCGKSSFMLQLREALKGKDELTVEFNAWRHDKEDELWAAFALEFIHQVSHWRPSQHNRIYHILYRSIAYLRLYSHRFRWREGWLDMTRAIVTWLFIISITIAIPVLLGIKGLEWAKLFSEKLVAESVTWQEIVKWTTGIGGGFASAAVIVSLWSKIRSFAGNPMKIELRRYLQSPDYRSHVAFIEHFHKDFGKIVSAYAGDRKVYVFIDDVDRCEVPKAAELMQALNLLISNDPHLIFIVGMDREKIAAGLAVKYEKLLPYLSSFPTSSKASDQSKADLWKGIEYGYTFIEKFIQLPFLVPRPTKTDLEHLLYMLSFSAEAVDEAVKSGLEESGQSVTESTKRQRESIRFRVTEDSQTIRDIALMVAPALNNNPRRLKQFINLFRLRVFIASETGLFDMTDDSSSDERLTLEKLGKFVAISLRWPILLFDLDADRQLLAKLQNYALKPVKETDVDDNVKRWIGRQDLIELLRSGCTDEKGEPDPDKEIVYGLAKLNVDRLLQISPKARVRT